MKAWLKKAAICGALLIVIVSTLGYTFRRELDRAVERFSKEERVRSIARYGSGLPPVDEIRVLRIAEQPPAGSGRGTFYTLFGSTRRMFIVEEKTITGDEAQELARDWRAQNLHNRYMALCFDPHHVVQFRADGSEICEAVICFACCRTTLPAFPFGTLVSFESDGRTETPAYRRFKSRIEGLVGRNEEPEEPPDFHR